MAGENIKICTQCNQPLPLDNFHKRSDMKDGLLSECKRCHNLRGHRPLGEDKTTGVYLGIIIAERILPAYFKNVQRMPLGHPGYDFICSNGYKIDVKSSTQRLYGGYLGWGYDIRRNKIADYFMLLGFDNRTDLNPIKAWLIPGSIIHHKITQVILAGQNSLAKWVHYEKPINQAVSCCEVLRCE